MKAKDYKHLKTINDGLMVLRHIRFKRQLWTTVKMKKKHICVITGDIIEKKCFAYRPLSNRGNRYHRISIKGMQIICDTEGK